MHLFNAVLILVQCTNHSPHLMQVMSSKTTYMSIMCNTFCLLPVIITNGSLCLCSPDLKITRTNTYSCSTFIPAFMNEHYAGGSPSLSYIFWRPCVSVVLPIDDGETLQISFTAMIFFKEIHKIFLFIVIKSHGMECVNTLQVSTLVGHMIINPYMCMTH